MTRRIPAAVLALTLASVGLLSGCAGAQPGVAARVGDETISVRDVNQISVGYCAAYERQLQGQGSLVPMEIVSRNVVQTLALEAVARQVADQYGVTTSTAYANKLADLQQASEVLADDAAEARVTVESAGDYINDIVEQAGRKTLTEDGAEDVSADDAVARGRDLISVWIASHDTEVDPRYDVELVEAQPAHTDTSVSFAVSDTARTGAQMYLFNPQEQTELQTRLTEQSRSMPASQVCG